jgi:two-component system, NarL family, nitrate/nitrite response regulator NarL
VEVAELRVLIVADDALARAGLAALLGSQPGFTVAGQAPAGAAGSLSAAVETYQPDLVLWDLGWSPESALARLAVFHPGSLPVAVLLPAGISAAQARSAWAAGARALLLRDADGLRLAAALAALLQGFAVVAPDIAALLLPAPAPALPPDGTSTGEDDWRAEEGAGLVEELTPRELQVLRLLAQGLPNKAIAQALSISEHTVKFHVNAILGKLAVQSRTEAVVRATRLGLILL